MGRWKKILYKNVIKYFSKYQKSNDEYDEKSQCYCPFSYFLSLLAKRGGEENRERTVKTVALCNSSPIVMYKRGIKY